MKLTCTLLLSCLFFVTGFAKDKKAYDKLCEVNAYWTQQQDINKLQYPANTTGFSERDWIATHLELVEQTLRGRSTSHLTAQQKANRMEALNHLNEYWHGRGFPVNEDFAYRLPIFIDKHDNFCAVGYLIKATGHEAVSRKVAANTNYAYVAEMNYPELGAWAKEYGFTVDELAWIQPGYPPLKRNVLTVGKGTDGEILELFVNEAGDKLFVGGKFTNVDSTIKANNIAYITESNGTYTWHNMGTGTDNAVHAIEEYNNKIFAAGIFSAAGTVNASNVAYWDGMKWNYAGCIYGDVMDLTVYNGKLYACGSFDVCASASDINFAWWDSTSNLWRPIPGLSGKVNTMQAIGGELILGGDFDYQSTSTNIMRYLSKGGFAPYGNTIAHEVMDIEAINGEIYAACKRVAADTNMLQKLSSNSWSSVANVNALIKNSSGVANSINTIYADNDNVVIGGDFTRLAMMGTSNLYSMDVTYYITGTQAQKPKIFNVDAAINTMVSFKGVIIGGGKFKHNSWFNDNLNSIFRAAPDTATSVQQLASGEEAFKVYPNPASGIITIENTIGADYMNITDVNGRIVLTRSLSASIKEQVDVSELSNGVYFIKLVGKNAQASQKLLIQ